MEAGAVEQCTFRGMCAHFGIFHITMTGKSIFRGEEGQVRGKNLGRLSWQDKIVIILLSKHLEE